MNENLKGGEHNTKALSARIYSNVKEISSDEVTNHRHDTCLC